MTEASARLVRPSVLPSVSQSVSQSSATFRTSLEEKQVIFGEKMRQKYLVAAAEAAAAVVISRGRASEGDHSSRSFSFPSVLPLLPTLAPPRSPLLLLLPIITYSLPALLITSHTQSTLGFVSTIFPRHRSPSPSSSSSSDVLWELSSPPHFRVVVVVVTLRWEGKRKE